MAHHTRKEQWLAAVAVPALTGTARRPSTRSERKKRARERALQSFFDTAQEAQLFLRDNISVDQRLVDQRLVDALNISSESRVASPNNS